jgi:predicted dehydrogenase
VLLPSFRADKRCIVSAIAGSDAKKTASLAEALRVPSWHSDWRELIRSPQVDAVAIATPPGLQSDIAIAALRAGKAVFAEKPMAADLAAARAMRDAANETGLAAVIDFTFHQIPAWQRMKSMLDAAYIGRLRHFAIHWHTENRATKLRLQNWKIRSEKGGGVIGNFVSHCFHYIEWFCGNIERLSCQVGGLPDDVSAETTAMLTLRLESGAVGSLSASCASYAGTGHSIELYGDDGTLVLANRSPDYMRGFELWHTDRRTAAPLQVRIEDQEADGYSDGRIGPTILLCRGFVDAIEKGTKASPAFDEGYRVQKLIEAARNSSQSGMFIDVRR